ncbi:MAG: lmo0937 family membrane protein [Bacteroidetes bacterium]|nr:lmo0937 family membrane protein [Bacteroidota bacterium]
MKNLNYIIALILIILWVMGFFTHIAGFSIHFLLIGAFTLILINVINDDIDNSPQQNINH